MSIWKTLTINNVMYNHIVHTDDFRSIPLFQDSKFWGENVGARAHLQQWLLRPCRAHVYIGGTQHNYKHLGRLVYVAANEADFLKL